MLSDTTYSKSLDSAEVNGSIASEKRDRSLLTSRQECTLYKWLNPYKNIRPGSLARILNSLEISQLSTNVDASTGLTRQNRSWKEKQKQVESSITSENASDQPSSDDDWGSDRLSVGSFPDSEYESLYSISSDASVSSVDSLRIIKPKKSPKSNKRMSTEAVR